MFKNFLKVALFPMNINIVNLADKAAKGINKVAEMETSDIVNIKDFNETEFVENVVC